MSLFLKYFFLIAAYVSCENQPLRNIRFDGDVSYTCCGLQSISHNLQLDGTVTDRLNRICWTSHSQRSYMTFYLAAVSSGSPNEGTLVDVPFTASILQIVFLNGGKLEFTVHRPYETWRIVCTFSDTTVSDAKTLFDNLYRNHSRRMAHFVNFEVEEIRKGPHHNTADSPYSSKTFIYYEHGPGAHTYIFTMAPWAEPISQPVLIISKGDFELVDFSISSKTASLRVRDEKYPYVFYFDNVLKTLEFSREMLRA